MALTALDVITEAQVLLNDVSGNLYTSAALLPLVARASRDMQDAMDINGIAILTNDTTVITIPANTTKLGVGTTPALPADFLEPISIEEKWAAESLYIPMTLRLETPQRAPETRLVEWVYRDGIYFVGATLPVDIQLNYRRVLPVIASTGTAIEITRALSYLSAKAASYAAKFIGENPSRAAVLDTEGAPALDAIIRGSVKISQAVAVRRQPFRRRRI